MTEIEWQSEPTEQEKARLAEILGMLPDGTNCAEIMLAGDGLPDEVVFDGKEGVCIRFIPKKDAP